MRRAALTVAKQADIFALGLFVNFPDRLTFALFIGAFFFVLLLDAWTSSDDSAGQR